MQLVALDCLDVVLVVAFRIVDKFCVFPLFPTILVI